MLRSLHIQNYALIDELDIEFHEGFSVITGETGAGKSIILGALGLIAGQRTEARMIKPGARRCVVEAVFEVEPDGVAPLLEANEIDFDGECILRRELMATGKSRAFVNDTVVSAALMKELGAQLIDIHSQHQNLLLNEQHFQLRVLDTLGEAAAVREEYRQVFAQLATTRKTLEELEARVAQNKAQSDYYSYQLNELDEAHLDPNEPQALEEEARLLEHADKISQCLYEADVALTDEERGAIVQLRKALRAMQRVGDVYAPLGELATRMDSCLIELGDVADEASRRMDEMVVDQDRQTYVHERLSRIYELEVKHKKQSVEELLAYAEELRGRLLGVEQDEGVIEELRARLTRGQQQLEELGARLTALRTAAKGRLEQEMQERLQPLGMPHVRFEVRLEPKAAAEDGMDNVTFLFSANKNVPLENLAHIASGGEIARVMLSLKALLAVRLQQPTLIFDEIDTGVSGHIAEKMALTMREMAQAGRQVFSITHLPQIAARGTYHYKVYKEDGADATATRIRRLNDAERVDEVAHMLSGVVLTEAAVNNAKELLNQKS